MKVNFLVENFGNFKFIGCSTDSAELCVRLNRAGIRAEINSKKTDFDIMHAHTFGPFVMSYLRKARKRGMKTVISAHSTPNLNEGNVIGSKTVWERIYKKIYNDFDFVLAVSDENIRELEKIGVKRPIEKIECGVDNELYVHSEKKGREFREFFGIDKDDFLVLNIAQMTPRKGIMDFANLANDMPDTKFMWVGGFPYSVFTPQYSKIKRMVKKSPKNLIFPGFIRNDECISIYGAYSGADVFLTLSKAESFGRTILEASSSGLPVIARRLSVFEELFGKNIIYAENLSEIRDKITSLKENPRILKADSKKIRKISQKYSGKKQADDMIRFYNSISNGNH